MEFDLYYYKIFLFVIYHISRIYRINPLTQKHIFLIRLIRGHDAIQFWHVGNAVNCTWTVPRLRIRICVRTLYTTLRICNKCVYFISWFHDLTFGKAIAGNQWWPSMGHLATITWFRGAVGFGFGGGRIVAHMQQRHEAKHFIWHG